MTVHRSALARLALACLLPAAARGQEAAASPFHAGQWGAQFGVSYGRNSVGAVRFSSPTSAWVVDGALFYRHYDADRTDPFGGSSVTGSYISTEARAGHRTHHPLAERVQGVTGFGTLGRYSHSSPATGGTAWGAGLYGEFGGLYLPVPRFSLGVLASLDASYGRENFGGGVQRTTSYSVGFGDARFVGTIYF